MNQITILPFKKNKWSKSSDDCEIYTGYDNDDLEKKMGKFPKKTNTDLDKLQNMDDGISGAPSFKPDPNAKVRGIASNQSCIQSQVKDDADCSKFCNDNVYDTNYKKYS